MKPKDHKNYLAKVVATNEDGKPVVQLYSFSMIDNVATKKKCDIDPLDLDIAKKEYSIIGLTR